MALDFKALVGLRSLGDGSEALARLGKEADLIVSQWMPEYGELARRGFIFSCMTAVTGIQTGTAIGTTPNFAIKNPIGSGKVLIPLVATLGYVSGTFGAGVITYCVNTPASSSNTLVIGSGAAITPYNSKGNASVMSAFTGGTLGATPTPVRPFMSAGASLGSTAVAPWTIRDPLNGELPIEPGGILSLQETGAGGSTPLVVYGFSWIEVPVYA